MRNVKKLFFTTIALTLTSFLMKTVAVWFNVYLAGLIGSIGIGIFQLIMAVYAFAKTLSYGGMNLAATRLCIDDFASFRHSMRCVLFISGTLGCVSCMILYLFFYLRPEDRTKLVLWEGLVIFAFYLVVTLYWNGVRLS